jgi:hypothetical protein
MQKAQNPSEEPSALCATSEGGEHGDAEVAEDVTSPHTKMLEVSSQTFHRCPSQLRASHLPLTGCVFSEKLI